MVLKKLFNDLINFSKISIKQIKYNLEENPKIDIIETKFVPNKIREYINNNIKYKYIINYNYNNKLITLEYYSKKIKKPYIFKIILYRIIFMMNISNIYIDINISIYETPYVKEINCYDHTKCNSLTSNNVNSGLNYGNNIIIFRKEELLKLLVHEIIHALDIDIKYENIKDKNKLLNKFCINKTNVLINESYVETWATIINVFLILYEKKTLNFDLFNTYLKDELQFGLYQSSKLCKFYNINKFESIYKINNTCNINMNDNVNIFSYHIIKTVNLNNLKIFIEEFRDDNYIMRKQYNYNDYIMFIIKRFNSINGKINSEINKLENTNYNLSLKMTNYG